MVMNSSGFPWLFTFIFCFLLTAFCLDSSSAFATQISYADHCNSIVPESTLKRFDPALSSFVQLHTGYYSGGNEILFQNPSDNSHPLTFRTPIVYKTDKDGVFAIEGSLLLRSRNIYYYQGDAVRVRSYGPGATSNAPGIRRRRSSVKLKLHGCWSEYSGNLCMVGRDYSYSKQGQLLNLQAILKLNNLKNSSSITTLVNGSLESLSSTDDVNYFKPISILIFPRMNYEYTLVAKETIDEFSGGNDGLKSLPLSSLPRNSFCSSVSRAVNEFILKYASDCYSGKVCAPFGEATIGYLPRVVSLKEIECLEEERRLRVLVEFWNSSYVGYYQPFDPNKTLVAEGLWDDKMNQLCVAGCRFLNIVESLASAYVGDCTTRLSLRFPAIWSIRETSNIVGRIWSKKAVNDSGYFNKIPFQNLENSFGTVPGLKYEYTEINRVRNLCLPKWKLGRNKGNRYPEGDSYDMQFSIWVKRPNENGSRGSSTPLYVGDQLYHRYFYPIARSSSSISKSVEQQISKHNIPVNISYRISIRMPPGVNLGGKVFSPDVSRSSYGEVDITAEGFYDAETGRLCMVGCRNIALNNQSFINDSMDCEILINLQFPPSNPEDNEYEGHIKGSIKSTRVASDPFYFEPLDVSSISFNAVAVKESITRMDLEIIMALVCNTLACLFVGLQLFHVKKHPAALPSISLFMLLLLTLGHMIPLVLNFKAWFLHNREQNILLNTSGWLEVNEVLVRIITMVAFLLEFWLLQLSWSAKLADDANQRGLWFAEKWTLFVSLPIYAAGALIFLLVNWWKQRNNITLLSYPPRYYPESHLSIWGELNSYAGLVLDGFLLPQILLNIFRNSKENALASSFYIGTTFFRLLPHAYNLFNSNADFSSEAWNVIISLWCLLFAAIVFLQQKFGGRCIIPQKFRDGKVYNTVLVVTES